MFLRTAACMGLAFFLPAAIVPTADAQGLPFAARQQQLSVPNVVTSLSDPWVEVADLDGDGDDDFVMIERGTSNLLVLMNQQNGLTNTALSYATGQGAVTIRVADFDADGDLDVAVYTEQGNSRRISMHANDGTGALAAPSLVVFPSSVTGFVLAELNGDNLPDIVRLRPTGNEGMINQGGFVWQGNAPVPYVEGDLFIDQDADGDDDIIRSTTSLEVFINSGGSFSPTPTSFGSGQTPLPNATFQISDIDGDADKDILLLATSAAPLASGIQAVRRTPQGGSWRHRSLPHLRN